MLLIYPSANIALVVRSIAKIALKPTRTGKGLRESKIVYFPGASRWTPQTGEPRTFKCTHIFLLTFPSLERLPNFCVLNGYKIDSALTFVPGRYSKEDAGRRRPGFLFEATSALAQRTMFLLVRTLTLPVR